jgi:hypothetical protein
MYFWRERINIVIAATMRNREIPDSRSMDISCPKSFNPVR